MTAPTYDYASVRASRIYRVNAWRELKGRPVLGFDRDGLIVSGWEGAPVVEKPVAADQPKPPEWWTTENTEAWTREQFGDYDNVSAAQGIWRYKMQGAKKAGAACYKPIPPKEMAKWRKEDPRPTRRFYFDGTPW